MGCDLCDKDDMKICHKCTRPKFSHEGVCVDECPSGWHPDWPDQDGRACRPWRLGDAGTAPYPFLICFAIFAVICAFGMMMRKAYLHKGYIEYYSPQNLVVCLIIAVAPLQFLSIVAQAIFSYIYGI